MRKCLTIGDHAIRPSKCFVVAEVAQAHDGSLGTAHSFIDIAADCGADAIKFQTHIASAESTRREPFRVKFSRQDATRYDYWKRMEFTSVQWAGLAKHALRRKLVFLSSPFSVEAVDLLEKIGMPAWKIGSGEVTNGILLDRVLKTGKPVLLSSGMSSLAELTKTVSRIKKAGRDVIVYQCTSKYPCPAEEAGLSSIPELFRKLKVPIGFSDHSGKPYAGIAAAALGALSVEAHITLSRRAFGPDVPSSLTPEEFAFMVEGIRFAEKAAASTYSKDRMAASMATMRSIFGRSIVACRSMTAGTIIRKSDLAVKKPAGGLSPEKMHIIIGKRLKSDKQVDDLILINDLK